MLADNDSGLSNLGATMCKMQKTRGSINENCTENAFKTSESFPLKNPVIERRKGCWPTRRRGE